jgi:chitin disaccharide deacetylase
MHKILIINADDFGWDADTVDTTINLFENSILTSASIMTGRSGSRQAIDFARKNQHKFSFGLHFNIVDNHVPFNPREINSLLNSELTFKLSNQQRLDGLVFRLKQVDIQKEFEYQILQLLNNSINISHIDSHGHLHKIPQILLAIKPIMKKYNITTIRIPQNIYQTKYIHKRMMNLLFSLFFYNTKHVDNFFMLENHNDMNWFSFFIKNIKSGITELGIHPGTSDKWRNIETKPFLNKKIASELLKNNIQIANYNILKEIS